jgi:hypothetical protein
MTRGHLSVRNVIENLCDLTGNMLCCHSSLASFSIIYRLRLFTGIEMTDPLFCLVLSWGLRRKIQSASREMPAIRPKGEASLCQLMTDPGGYSVTSSSAISLFSVCRKDATFSIRGTNGRGIVSPFGKMTLVEVVVVSETCDFSFCFESLEFERMQIQLSYSSKQNFFLPGIYKIRDVPEAGWINVEIWEQ